MIATERPIAEWALRFWDRTTYTQMMAPVDCDLSMWGLLNARDAIGESQHGAFVLTVHDYAKHFAMNICYRTFGKHFSDMIRVIPTPLIPEDAWALDNGERRYISNGA